MATGIPANHDWTSQKPEDEQNDPGSTAIAETIKPEDSANPAASTYAGNPAAPGVGIGRLYFVADQQRLATGHTAAHEAVHAGQHSADAVATTTAALQKDDPQVDNPSAPVILIGDSISVSDLSRFEPARLAGVVCLGGSRFSHSILLAEALGIPAIVNLATADQLVPDSLAIVDGDSGKLYLNPTLSLQQTYQDYLDLATREQDELDSLRDQPAVTRDGTEIHLYANTGLLADARPGLLNGAQGIGLYRSELPFLAGSAFPTEDDQYSVYREILSLYQSKPVTMRLLDIGGDKQLPYHPMDERNPAMGLRGIRFLLQNPDLFRTQLRAMLRANIGLNNLRLLLPMVTNAHEVKASKQAIHDALRSLLRDGMQPKLPQIGLMIEVPAIISQLDEVADNIDFLSVGTNDLTSFLLGIDRASPLVAEAYDSLHPAVVDMLLKIIAEAQRLKLPLTVCGEIANTETGIVLLLSTGVRDFSIHATNIPRVKRLLKQLDMADVEAIFRNKESQSRRTTLRSRAEAYIQRRNLETTLRQVDARTGLFVH